MNFHSDGGHRNHIHISFGPHRAGSFITPEIAAEITGVSSSTGAASSSANVTLFKKNFKGTGDKLTPEQVFDLLKNYSMFGDEAAAIFTAIAYRECRYVPYSANPSGYFGLWQWGSRTSDGSSDGKKVVALAYPKEERIKVWKLSYVNWEKEELTEATIDAKLKVVQGDSTGNAGKEYYDDRVWIPVNQARLLRSKLGRNNLAEIINESGFKGNAGNSITFPWGERYLVNSWISGVPFAVASSTYVKMTGKTENQLKEWIRKNIPKDSTVRNIDPENNISKLENWINDTIPANSLSTTEKTYKLYKTIYIE